MSKTWIILKRECLTRVRTKGFIIGTVVSPLLLILIFVLPSVFVRTGSEGKQRIAVIDFTRRLMPDMKSYADGVKRDGNDNPLYELAEIQTAPDNLGAQKQALNERILKGELNVYLVIPADVFETNQYELYAKNISNFQLNESLNGMVSSTVSKVRLSESGLDPVRVAALNHRVGARTFKIAESGTKEENSEAAFMLSYILAFMIYIALVFYGQFVMRGVIEDKQSRVVEVMLSSARPNQIMAGKILGIGLTGLIQMAVWALLILFTALYGIAAVRPFVSAAGKIPIPSVSEWTLVSFVVFFLLGYFLYAAIYAALGSLGNSDADIQNLQWPALVPLIFAMLVMMAVVKNPEGKLSLVLSLIPFFTPMLMFLRISVHSAPLAQIIVSIVLCLLTIAGLVWVTGRIFRIGILMYGKRPTLPEAWKWIRYS